MRRWKSLVRLLTPSIYRCVSEICFNSPTSKKQKKQFKSTLVLRQSIGNNIHTHTAEFAWLLVFHVNFPVERITEDRAIRLAPLKYKYEQVHKILCNTYVLCDSAMWLGSTLAPVVMLFNFTCFDRLIFCTNLKLSGT